MFSLYIMQCTWIFLTVFVFILVHQSKMLRNLYYIFEIFEVNDITNGKCYLTIDISTYDNFFIFLFIIISTGKSPSYIIIFVNSIQFTQETIILQLGKIKKKKRFHIDI